MAGKSAKGTPNKRLFGMYYTPQLLADSLSHMAVDNSSQTVLDPAVGEGALLKAAMKALQTMGAVGAESQLYGIDVSEVVRAQIAAKLSEKVAAKQIIIKDFMETTPPDFDRKFSIVIGNPPFVKYHLLTQSQRQSTRKAIAATNEALSGRASLWAYFVVHSIGFLEEGGTLAMILPRALTFTQYGTQVVNIVHRDFASIDILEVKGQPFSEAEEQVVLLIAKGKGKGPGSIRKGRIESPTKYRRGKRQISIQQFGSNKTSWQMGTLSSISGKNWIKPLGNWYSVRIGTVTGCNSFFLMNKTLAEEHKLQDFCLKPVVSTAKSLHMLDYVLSDFSDRWDSNHASKILILNAWDSISKEISEYIRHGQEQGVHERYKCRVRDPWYVLRDVEIPDAFFHYCASSFPHMVLNSAEVMCTNAVHRLTLNNEFRGENGIQRLLAVSSASVISQIATEICGRTYGGGVLKLEPSEVLNIPLVAADIDGSELSRLSDNVDKSLRNNEVEDAMHMVDEGLLRRTGLLTSSEVHRFENKWKNLSKARKRSARHNGAFTARTQ
jgi:tRNA1(Val) A37 N6-methylase TrmN6